MAVFPMFPSLDTKLKRFEELEQQLQDPEVLADTDRMIAVQREYGGLQKVAKVVREYYTREADIEAARMMLDEETDADAKAYAQAELDELIEKQEALKADLEDLAAAGDSITRGGLIMEIRAGTGGDEAALFAGDLFEMYQAFIENRGWKMEVMDVSHSDDGRLQGDHVFRHRRRGVSRIAIRERRASRAAGSRNRNPRPHSHLRRHGGGSARSQRSRSRTSAMKTCKSTRCGPAVPAGKKSTRPNRPFASRTLPTGTVVKCQDEKSQHKNKARAMRILRSRVLEAKQREAANARADARRTLIGSGDRSQRIRTYNFPQGRITDHRINLTLYKLDQVMQGNLDELIDALLEFDRNERLQSGGEKN